MISHNILINAYCIAIQYQIKLSTQYNSNIIMIKRININTNK